MPLWLSDELSVCANTRTQHDSRLGANFTLSAGAAAAAARRICSAPRSLCLTWSVIFTFDHNLLMFMPHKGGIGTIFFTKKERKKMTHPSPFPCLLTVSAERPVCKCVIMPSVSGARLIFRIKPADHPSSRPGGTIREGRPFTF